MASLLTLEELPPECGPEFIFKDFRRDDLIRYKNPITVPGGIIIHHQHGGYCFQNSSNSASRILIYRKARVIFNPGKAKTG